MNPPAIQKLINLFSKFPTIGPRTASRFVFYLLKLPQKELNEFLNSIINLKKSIKICSFCFNPFESLGNSDETLCPICRNKSRNRTLLCIIEKEIDLISIEKTKKYKGLYFILGGTIDFKKNNKKIRTSSFNPELRIGELKKRIKNPESFGIKNANFKEIIIATNPTPEGEATTLLVERELNPLGVKITRLGRGLPTGGELEYADEETLESAFEGRK